ncbi:DNA-binding transcriptional regulator, AcrR family [Mesobacillus persicus]|uniref:DNA-binding transcriptional regulator, AcrR family n=1 Tax=Mesobacillus persicus TaxID=930146 RepID=A0A1H8JZH5_9BACI|nr:TetR/AcrR family transcriptional regulator [Mesobacillus persicus]SEN85935.1 DNA-binding transcriptional regulator, AcrR family [Mesobacillus persicus]
MTNKNDYIDRRILKSKKALKDAIISLMQQKDFKEVTISDIVRLADLNRGTFYKHYQYKEDLLDDIIDEVITDLIASYREPYQNIATFDVSKLSSNAIKIFEHVHKYAEFYKLIVNSNVLTSFQHKICIVIKDLVMQDVTGKLTNPNINKELIASYHSYAIFGMMIELIHSGFKYSSSYMAEQLLAIIHSHNN